MARPMRIKRLDARSVRALAHPLRVRLLGSLRFDGPGTASTLAARLGESSGATSYHLRALADHGFIEEDTSRGRGRERWWRAAHEATSWRPEDFQDDPDALAAREWLSGFVARQGMAWLDDWLTRRPSADPAWVAVSTASDYRLNLTPPEMHALLEELHEVIRRHDAVAEDRRAAEREAGGDALGDGDEGQAARAVQLLLYAFPAADRGPEAGT
jgi:DNA-binding transcriptional ArsR family regulator